MRWTLKAFVLTTGLAALAAPALAGDAVRLTRAVDGGQVTLRLDPELAASWKTVNVGRLVMQTPARQRRLDLGPLAKSGDLVVDLAETKSECVLVLAELGPADAKGRADAWRRVTHASKHLVCPAGDGREALLARRRAGSVATAKTGSRVEVRPLLNPATVRPGKDIAVRVYFEGAPRTDAEVTASGPGGAELRAVTGPTGVAVLRISASGAWTVRYRARHGDETYEASLAFDVLPDAAWRPYVAGGA